MTATAPINKVAALMAFWESFAAEASTATTATPAFQSRFVERFGATSAQLDEIAAIEDLGDVAGAQPARGVDGFSGLVGLSVVALQDEWAVSSSPSAVSFGS
ncbi:hypothetical protein [Nocardia lijiangensis]|uniref:hypothetical protein n=1 Tax=Nocardia lijiangensis TaxID=299618 RepID=UPI00082B4A02|nr:hypothetical protein [Nocardia lijiangensis]